MINSLLNSKLRLKSNQVSAVSNAYIRIQPTLNKGSVHDNMLKLKQELEHVVVKVMCAIWSVDLCLVSTYDRLEINFFFIREVIMRF